MENYIVSARKYRPETFETVIGQPAVTTTLKNAVRTRQLAHAYLFCGPRGIGKTTCARIFAKTINCFNITGEIEACNECESCLSFNSSRSYNIHELDGASNNSVDDIRSLIEQVRIPPQIGKYSIYIIDEVHMLSSNAFNAFLKTLEEPPAHAIFILATTEKHKIIPTILSRCQIFDFNRIKIEDIALHLAKIAKTENIEAEREGLDVIAQKADGAMRDALSIFDQIVSFSGGAITYGNVIDNLNVLDYDYYFKLTEAIITANIPSSLMIFDEILGKGFDSQNFINGLSRHFRDLLVCKDEITIQLLDVGTAVREKYRIQSKACSQEFILNSLDLTNKCDLAFRSSRNQRLHVELCLLQLCGLQAEEKKKSEPRESLLINDKNPGPAAGNDPAISHANSNTQEGAKSEKKSEDQKIKAEAGNGTGKAAGESSANQMVSEGSEESYSAEKLKKDAETKISPEYDADPVPVKKERSFDKSVNNTISIKDFLNGKSATPEVETEDNPIHDKEEDTLLISETSDDFTEKELMEQWKKFANQIRNKHTRLYNTLLSNKPTITSQTSIEFEISNPLQQEALDKIKPELLNHLRRELNRNIELLFCINETMKESRLYLPEDKYEHMLKKNPDLAVFRQKFNLDFE